jgi:hypothetical protein
MNDSWMPYNTDKTHTEKTYSYCFNGLFVNSEIYIPQVSISENIPPQVGGIVAIRYGTTPDAINNANYSSPVLSVSATEVLITIHGAARYYIKGKDEVWVEPFPGAAEKSVRLYILSIVLGVLLHRNNVFALHASTIKYGNEAILFTGQSGAGKSTLALGLYRKGYEIINDDISSVFFDGNGTPFVYPGVVHLKLWARSLEKYGYETDGFDRIKDELEKYSFPVPRVVISALPVKAIYFLSESGGEEIESVPILGLEKFQKIKANTYRYKLIEHMQNTAGHFAAASKFADKVPLIRVQRPQKMSPKDFSEYMEAQFLTL